MSQFLSAKNWHRVFLYLLFICSTFSIAGTEASIAMLYLITFSQWIRDRRIAQLSNPLLWVILIFVSFAVLSGLLNAYNVNHLMALRTHWRLLLPLLLAGILGDVDEEHLLWVFFAFVMLIALYGIIQHFTGVDWLRPEDRRMTTPYLSGISGAEAVFHGKGNFTHHLTYGGFLLLCFPLFASLMFCKDWVPSARLITGGIGFLVLLGIGASLGRSIWLGTAAAIGVLFFRFSPKLMLALSIFVIAGGAYFYSQFRYAEFQMREPANRIEALQQRFISGFMLKANQDRLLMWESGVAAVKDHFWVGIGYDKDTEIMPAYRSAIIERTGHRFNNNAGSGVHNIYLQTWVNYGLLGLLGYLSIFAVFLGQSLRALSQTVSYSYENSILWAGIAGVCGFMVAGVFENNFRDGEVQTMLLLLMGLSLHQSQKLKSRIFKY